MKVDEALIMKLKITSGFGVLVADSDAFKILRVSKEHGAIHARTERDGATFEYSVVGAHNPWGSRCNLRLIPVSNETTSAGVQVISASSLPRGGRVRLAIIRHTSVARSVGELDDTLRVARRLMSVPLLITVPCRRLVAGHGIRRRRLAPKAPRHGIMKC